MNDLLSGREAAALLDVKLSTLYAYVSRGWLRSVQGGPGPGRLYPRADLERLKARHRARAGHGAVAAGALRFGEPALESEITEITATGQRYHGHSAIELAAGGEKFESVAELLWSGERSPYQRWVDREHAIPTADLGRMIPRGTPPTAVLPLLVAALALRDPARFDAPPDAERRRARLLIRRMAVSLALARDPRRVRAASAASCVADSIAIALGIDASRRTRSALDQALVLVADHELNASSFAARVAASTGADLYACIGVALGALSGPLHGGACDRVEALAAEIGQPARAAAVMLERTRRGDSVPGFGHPLYPEGDPRAAWLLRRPLLRTRATRVITALIDAMFRAGRERPTIDVALVSLAQGLCLGPGAAAAIFAIGRSAGWIAHVLEQRRAGFLVRPRAQYTGRSAPR